jgi:hypothetical protein
VRRGGRRWAAGAWKFSPPVAKQFPWKRSYGHGFRRINTARAGNNIRERSSDNSLEKCVSPNRGTKRKWLSTFQEASRLRQHRLTLNSERRQFFCLRSRLLIASPFFSKFFYNYSVNNFLRSRHLLTFDECSHRNAIVLISINLGRKKCTLHAGMIRGRNLIKYSLWHNNLFV